jgi:hypothetical protein
MLLFSAAKRRSINKGYSIRQNKKCQQKKVKISLAESYAKGVFKVRISAAKKGRLGQREQQPNSRRNVGEINIQSLK